MPLELNLLSDILPLLMGEQDSHALFRTGGILLNFHCCCHVFIFIRQKKHYFVVWNIYTSVYASLAGHLVSYWYEMATLGDLNLNFCEYTKVINN